MWSGRNRGHHYSRHRKGGLVNNFKGRAFETIGLIGLCLTTGMAKGADAQAPADNNSSNRTSAATGDVQEVVVTGYRKSLTQSTDAKRDAIGFIDQINAEDIGKFPDTNIAESFNRIPGIT